MESNDKKTASASGNVGQTQVSVSAETKSEPKKKYEMHADVTSEPKKKKGSTKTTRRAKDVEKRVTKAMRRFSRAAESAVDKYTERRDKSDRKRKDGALIDMSENLMRGISKGASKAAPSIGDAMKVLSTKKTRKSVRRSLRSIPAVPFM